MRRILLDIQEDMMRVALVFDGELLELYYETRQNQSLVGNLYLGKVEKVVSNLQACFVDFGEDKNGFLYYGKKRAINDEGKNQGKPKTGDMLVVQVEKDAYGTKGAMLTQDISLAGRFLVLLDETGEKRISKKIKEEAERERIRHILEEILPNGYGLLVRTNGANRTKEEFQEEVGRLLKRAELMKRSEFLKPPVLLVDMSDPLERVVRDFHTQEIEEFVVNSKKVYERLCNDWATQKQNTKLIYHEEKQPIFSHYLIESQLQKALQKKVWLKSGGYLIIEETEACVVIDVNSAKSAGSGTLEKSILKTNQEAAVEVAKQARLRNLSGIIIVDFIDMKSLEHKNILQKTLSIAIEQDRMKMVLVGMTELGLMQLTRKKTRPSLLKQTTYRCRHCKGEGVVRSLEFVVLQIRHEIEVIFANTIYKTVTLETNEKVMSAVFGQNRVYQRAIEERFGVQLLYKNNQNIQFLEYNLYKE